MAEICLMQEKKNEQIEKEILKEKYIDENKTLNDIEISKYEFEEVEEIQ
jgi:hypothetical protein